MNKNNERKPSREELLKDYIQVNERILEFWKRYPNGRIHTEIVSWQDGIIVMRGMAWRDINDLHPAAVGHAYEREGSTFINQTSVLENAESSCVGRILAIMGFHISRSIASKEEVANAMNQQEALKQEEDRSNDPAIKAKWAMLAGNLDEYESGIKKLKDKGMTWAQIDELLTIKIKKKQEDKTNE